MANKFDALKYASDSDDSGDENFIDVDHLGPVEISNLEHELQYTYNFWFAKKGSHKASLKPSVDMLQDYGKSLHFIGRCATVEQWWAMYCHLVRPTTLKPYRKLHLFKSGIKPMWEDPANIKGGKWILRLRKNKIDRAWESTCLAMLGEQFGVGDEICGIELSTQFPEDGLSVWNRTATDQTCTSRIRDTLRRILNLPPNVSLEYKPHIDNLKAFSSNVVSKIMLKNPNSK